MKWECRNLRGVAYSEIENLQQALRRQIVSNPDQAFLLFSEPTPTLTGGISASDADLLWPLTEYEKRGITIQRVHRGGKWTYHGPGQILVYPLFKLSRFFPKTRVRGYLETFRKALLGPLQKEIAALGTGPESLPFGLYHKKSVSPSKAEAPKGTGKDEAYEKVVSFGVGIQAGITAHGAAVYHSGNQTFPGVVPCGLKSGCSLSLDSTGWTANWEQTANLLAQSIFHEFETAR